MLIAFQTKPDHDLSEIGLHLTIREVAERLGISEDAARALVRASLRSGLRLPCHRAPGIAPPPR